MAQSVMKRNPESWMIDFRESPKWNYTQGLVLLSLEKVWKRTDDSRYFDYVKSFADEMINEEGDVKTYSIDNFNIDHITPGRILFTLYDETGDEKYLKTIKLLRNQLRWQPRTTDGGFWHKLRYPWQMWLDGIYMGSPFYAEYSLRNDEPEYFEDIVRQITLIEKHTRDKQSGLLYHGWDESRVQKWSDPETGTSPMFWGRAMGWYAMALVDVLDFLPEDHEGRSEVIDVLNRLAEAAVKVQDPATGVWYQVLDMPERDGNYRESSASCMFVYALVKGVKNGYLEEDYLQAARKGYEGILSEFIEVDEDGEVHITKGCSVAGLGGNPYRSGSYEYYISEEVRSNDPKATGSFIMASLEFEEMGIEFTKK